MADRATLEAWIAETTRNQRRLGKILPFAAIAAVLLLIVSRPIGAGAIGLVAMVGVFGYWITSSHITDWETRLDELDRPRPVGRAVQRR